MKKWLLFLMMTAWLTGCAAEDAVETVADEILVPVMFDVPDRDDIAQVIIHRGCVTGGEAPELVLAEPDERSA